MDGFLMIPMGQKGQTEPSRQDYEPLPVKRTVKKYKIFPATSNVLLLVAFRDGGAYKILD